MSRFDAAEATALADVLSGNSLWPYDGPTVWAEPLLGAMRAIEDRLPAVAPAAAGARRRVLPSSSGTASLHIALGGLGIPAGSEVIVPPITDMGTIMPIIFQNAIPVFADLDLDTGLMTPETVEAALTERTRAVIVVHLAGSPVDVEGVMAVCRAAQKRFGRTIRVIEDCAQALGATLHGRPLGSFGDAGCFSLNTWKHLTCGEGGFVVLRDAADFAPCLLFGDKHRDRLGDGASSYRGSGLNYRASLIDGAMMAAQLPKLDKAASKHNALGRLAEERLGQLPGVVTQQHLPGAFPTYFMVMFRLDGLDDPARKERILRHVAGALGGGVALRVYGAYCPPIYRSGVFAEKRFFACDADAGPVLWPAELVARELERRGHYTQAVSYDYTAVSCPSAEAYAAGSFCMQLGPGTEADDIVAATDAFAAAFEAA